MTCPVPPPVPIARITARMRSFGSSPAGSWPATSIPSDGGPRPLPQGLGREHVLNLARADPECQRAECPVGACVAVAANDGHTGKRQPQLGSDHMDDALAAALDVVERDSQLAAVRPQSLHLAARKRIADVELVVGGNVVVQRGKSQVGPTHPPACQAETIKCLGAGYLMNQVAIDVKQRCLCGRGDHVAIPYFLKQRLWHARSTFA